MDSIASNLNKARGRGNNTRGPGKEALSPPKPETQHLETQPSEVRKNATRPLATEQQFMNKVNDAIYQQQLQRQKSTDQQWSLPTAPPAPAARNCNEAALGSNWNSVPPEKPAFTRGISVIDQTAVTSTAPTPAGEIQNPLSIRMGQCNTTRQRESHLPDEDLREQIRTMSKGEPLDDAEGDDEFGDNLSRQETAKPR